MTAQAATLAGGSNNQDRYLIGDDFAMVLDGATSLAGDRSHDPGWFAGELADAIARRIADPGTPLADAVTAAIRDVRDEHHLTPDASPTSTIALARWTADHVETYVLGDSSVVLLMADGRERVLTDTRLAAVAPEIQRAYRDRLAQGHGFDAEHRKLLTRLQRRQADARNTAKGYWIAGSEPSAGKHGMYWRHPLDDIAAIMLASDGVAPPRHLAGSNWTDVYCAARTRDALSVLRRIHDAEAADHQGQQWPRSKRHDDKTIILAEPRAGSDRFRR